MDLSPFEMGVLRSQMTEGSAAVVLGRSAAWVVRTRAALGSTPTPQPAPVVMTDVGVVEVAAAGPSVVVQVAVQRSPWPADLMGRDLAAWLYDNSDLTFDQIAQTAGVPLPVVQWIADGQPDPMGVQPKYAPGRKSGRPAKTGVFEGAPGDTTYVATSDTGALALYMVKALAKEPRALKVAVVSFQERVPRTAAPEIPPRVLRWARWFVDARWQMQTVAELFDVPESALRSALAVSGRA